MADTFPTIVVVRHGETAWSAAGRHTGRTDVPLTPGGEAEARGLGERLSGRSFRRIVSGPQRRAVATAELAGFAPLDAIDPDLAEWDYGEYEGLRTVEIRRERPDWRLFRDGCPGGESVADVAARADRVIDRLRSVGGDVLVFSSSHLLRVLAARWIGLDPSKGGVFVLGTASLSVLGYEHDLSEPAIHLWNARA